MADLIRLVGLGAGGHATSVLDAIDSTGSFDVVALVVDDNAGGELLGVPILGPESLERLRAEGIGHAFVGVGGIEDPGPRSRVFERLLAAGYELPALVHARASISRWATLGRGVQVLAGAVVNAGSELGDGAIVNTGAIVEHDCRIGAHAHIAPGATLGGDVTVGAGAHVGLGASVLQGLTIGEGALVALGAVVVRNVTAGTRVAGVPARAFPRRP